MTRLEYELRLRGIPASAAEPMRITPEMRAWARAAVGREGTEKQQIERLLTALLTRPEAPMRYRPGATTSAEEVWKSGRANCLAFTHLYIALARSVGLDVYYLRVHDLASYDREGDLVVASDHVTAAWGPAASRIVLDFSSEPIRNYREIQPVPDRTALAMHYSNLGAEQLLGGHESAALVPLALATRIDPSLADAWVNLGVADRRNGDFAGAELAYRRALAVDPDQISAYQDLSGLLSLLGRDAEAGRLAVVAERAGARNPWSYLALGDLALRRGDTAAAEKLYRRAHRLDPGGADALVALARCALAEGRQREARQLLRRAERLDAADRRVSELSRRLDSLRSDG